MNQQSRFVLYLGDSVTYDRTCELSRSNDVFVNVRDIARALSVEWDSAVYILDQQTGGVSRVDHRAELESVEREMKAVGL